MTTCSAKGTQRRIGGRSRRFVSSTSISWGERMSVWLLIGIVTLIASVLAAVAPRIDVDTSSRLAWLAHDFGPGDSQSQARPECGFHSGPASGCAVRTSDSRRPRGFGRRILVGSDITRRTLAGGDSALSGIISGPACRAAGTRPHPAVVQSFWPGRPRCNGRCRPGCSDFEAEGNSAGRSGHYLVSERNRRVRDGARRQLSESVLPTWSIRIEGAACAESLSLA